MATFIWPPEGGGGGGGVTSLNTLTGDVLIVPGADGITVTQVGQTITVNAFDFPDLSQYVMDYTPNELNSNPGTPGVMLGNISDNDQTNLQILFGSTDTGVQANGTSNVYLVAGDNTASISSGNAGSVIIQAGTIEDGNGTAGNVSIIGGSSFAHHGGNAGGNIYLSPGTGGPLGAIQLNDLSGAIQPGQTWTATDTSGSGHWSNAVPFDFGDGSDGAATLDGTATYPWAELIGSVYYLEQPVYLTSLTINSGITLETESYSVFVNGMLANSGTIDSSGLPGGNGGVGGQGIAGLAGLGPGAPGNTYTQNASQDLGWGATGAAGAAGSTIAGAQGTSSFNYSSNFPLNANGGAAGAGGNGTGGIGGIAVPITLATGPSAIRFVKLTNNLLSFNTFSTTVLPLFGGIPGNGGSSGGGDGTNNGGAGGGGGAAGGVIAIFAYQFNNMGTINANGGNGGNGESPAVFIGGIGGGGGGGGGAGGLIYIVSSDYISTGTISAIGGNGGSEGAGQGTGTSGTAGSSGGSGLVQQYQTSTGEWL
jgi:hypothetical protein